MRPADLTRVVVATNNKDKYREIRQLLADFPIELVFPAFLGRAFSVDEDGASYAENAAKKALAATRTYGLPALAEDSGLEIDGLDGAPGILSGRFLRSQSHMSRQKAGVIAHESPSGTALRESAPGCQAILQRLALSGGSRHARFRCLVAWAPNPKTRPMLFEGICEGSIADEARGDCGFGYDPIFIPEGHERTFAELGESVKNQISHRARALARLKEYLLATPPGP